MDTLTEKIVYPCAPATEEELINTIGEASNGVLKSCEKLQKMIIDIPEDQISWSSIHTLCFLGTANDKCNEALAKAHLQPGVYVNHTGNWLFLIRMDDTIFQSCIDRCGAHLISLDVYNIELSSLDFSSLIWDQCSLKSNLFKL